MKTKFGEVKVGDRIKIKCGTMSGWVRGWRKVTGFWGNHIEVRANGQAGFLVKPEEVIGIEFVIEPGPYFEACSKEVVNA